MSRSPGRRRRRSPARRWASASQAKPIVLAIFGPTAAGKSALAHAAALALDGEIVVADPFQRYRRLEIAADAPGLREREEVSYHFVGDLDLTDTSSAGEYAPKAHHVIDAIVARGRIPIVAGGTGLYLRAALADFTFPRDVPPETRRDVETLVASDFDAAVAELAAHDAAAANRVDRRNPRRVARALELARSGIQPLRLDQLWTGATRRPTLLIGVVRPREHLDRLIDIRVRRELDSGLLHELERAIDSPGLSREAAQIIGIREVTAVRAGEVDLSKLPELLAARTRRLARAQLTWLRKTPEIIHLDLGTAPAADGVPRVLALWREATKHGGAV